MFILPRKSTEIRHGMPHRIFQVLHYHMHFQRHPTSNWAPHHPLMSERANPSIWAKKTCRISRWFTPSYVEHQRVEPRRPEYLFYLCWRIRRSLRPAQWRRTPWNLHRRRLSLIDLHRCRSRLKSILRLPTLHRWRLRCVFKPPVPLPLTIVHRFLWLRSNLVHIRFAVHDVVWSSDRSLTSLNVSLNYTIRFSRVSPVHRIDNAIDRTRLLIRLFSPRVRMSRTHIRSNRVRNQRRSRIIIAWIQVEFCLLIIHQRRRAERFILLRTHT